MNNKILTILLVVLNLSVGLFYVSIEEYSAAVVLYMFAGVFTFLYHSTNPKTWP